MGTAPKYVELAVRMVWVMIGINAVTTGLATWLAPGSQGSGADGAVIFAVVFAFLIWSGFWFWLSLQIGEGKKWARTAFIVLAAIAVAFAARKFGSTYQQSVVAALLLLIQPILSVVASGMLLHSSSRAWFEN